MKIFQFKLMSGVTSERGGDGKERKEEEKLQKEKN